MRKALEQFFLILVADADARVGDKEKQFHPVVYPGSAEYLDRNLAPGGKFLSVGQKIVQYLHYPQLISYDIFRYLRGYRHEKFESLLGNPVDMACLYVIHHTAERKFP